MMKKVLLAIAIASFTFAMTTEKAEAQFSAGGGLVFGTGAGGLNNDIGLDIRGVYRINEQWRGVLNVHYFFVESPAGLYTIDFNGNYIFMDEGKTMLYGLAGLQIGVVTFSFNNPFTGTSTSESSSEIGLNIGAGVDHDLGGVALFGEVKFVVSDLDQLVIAAGVRVPFGD